MVHRTVIVAIVATLLAGARAQYGDAPASPSASPSAAPAEVIVTDEVTEYTTICPVTMTDNYGIPTVVMSTSVITGPVTSDTDIPSSTDNTNISSNVPVAESTPTPSEVVITEETTEYTTICPVTMTDDYGTPTVVITTSIITGTFTSATDSSMTTEDPDPPSSTIENSTTGAIDMPVPTPTDTPDLSSTVALNTPSPTASEVIVTEAITEYTTICPVTMTDDNGVPTVVTTTGVVTGPIISDISSPSATTDVDVPSSTIEVSSTEEVDTPTPIPEITSSDNIDTTVPTPSDIPSATDAIDTSVPMPSEVIVTQDITEYTTICPVTMTDGTGSVTIIMTTSTLTQPNTVIQTSSVTVPSSTSTEDMPPATDTPLSTTEDDPPETDSTSFPETTYPAQSVNIVTATIEQTTTYCPEASGPTYGQGQPTVPAIENTTPVATSDVSSLTASSPSASGFYGNSTSISPPIITGSAVGVSINMGLLSGALVAALILF